MGVSELGRLPEAEAARRLDELRGLYTDALVNRESR
jgi:hypothetical protein